MSVALPDFLLAEDIKFYLSGGTNNTDPIFSIGGPISNTEIINNILHNLFDRVETKEATEGDQEWRCFYIKNTHPKETLAGTKIWIESGTSSSKTYISLGIGAAGINQQEILIPNENTDPAIVSFSIPLEPPEDPNIGDLGPGDHVGIWVKYTVQEGAEERAEDTAILRIEGERVPIQAFFPPIACPTNTHFDPNTNTCIPVTQIPECPAGFHYDETVQNCVLDNTPPITCPAGTHYDPNTAACIPINQTPTCPAGFHYDESIQNCVPDGGAPPAVSLFNMGIAGDWSCNNDAENTMNNIADFIGTTGILIALGDLSYVDGDESCWIQLTEDIFPAQFPNSIYPAIGNHDDSEDGAASDRDEIIDAYPAIPSQGYYSFTKGNIRFIIMDTQSSYGTGSSQYQFVSNELRMADADPSIMWIIVGYHKPSIVPDTDHGAETGVRDAYHPLFDQYHVDMICSGHNHNYSRSKPIKFNSSSPNSPTVMSNATTGYIDVDGRIFITVGTAGQSSLDNINDNPAWMAASNDSDRGALLVSLTETVSGRGNQLNCRFRTNNGDDDDVFTITKSASPNPPPGGGGGSGGGGNPPPSGGGVGVDSNGILWMYATGAQSVVEQSRFDSNDFRWSEVYDNIAGGYESTLYFTFDGVASDGHCAAKMWGGNHSGDCQYTEGGDCCCIEAGYKVKTINGLIPIEQIKVGDLVYTHEGRYRKVTKLFQHCHQGEMYSIKTYGTSNYDTTATHTHPFLTKDKGWIRAENLTTQDWIPYPINQTVNDISIISIPYSKKVGNQHGTLETIASLDLELKTELLTVIGYYLAEGHTYQGRITFTFSSKENDSNHIQYLTDSILKLGFTPHRFERKEFNTSIISFHSIPLANWLTQEFGHGAKNKKLPQWIIELPNNKTKTILESYLNGDGYNVNKGRHKSRHVKSISENLLCGMRDIALRLGYKTSLRKQNNIPLESTILGRLVKINTPYELYISKNADNSKILLTSRYQYNKIRSIDKKLFHNFVYNLEVEEDHSYIVTTHTSHNCWYDLGIRADGEVQLQTERPHPSNHDFSLPSNQLPISDIGVSMDGRTIGLKWLIYPVKIGGDVEDGGIRIKMWADTSGFQNNRPQNVWRLCIDMLDTGSILGDMPALDEQEIEIRNSDTDDTNDYAGGVHVRYLRRPQDIP